MSRVLDVFLQDGKAGELKQNEDASLTFTYAGNYFAGAPLALSEALPVQKQSFIDRVARPFSRVACLMHAPDVVWPQRSAYPRVTPSGC